MPRFVVKFVVRQVIFWLVIALGLVGLGRFRTDPMLPLFTNPDGTRCEIPCLFGIRPGQTTFQEAIALAQAHPLTRNLRLFQGDFGDAGFWFHGVDYSVLFVGQDGQEVALQIYRIADLYHDHPDPSSARYNQVWGVCLRSVFNAAKVELPYLSPALSRMWHSTSLLQMVATLGPPDAISHPAVLPTYAWLGLTRMESYYYDHRLIVTHSSDGSHPPDLRRNYFSSICVYSEDNFDYRLNSGFHGPVGALLPWLGATATIEDYQKWTTSHTVVMPKPVAERDERS